ncbi:MAG: hypothetical protein AAGI01_15460, partial [Myxococcota bacterium]
NPPPHAPVLGPQERTLERVHADLLPAWVIDQSRVHQTGDSAAAEASFETLVDALGEDFPEGAELIGELRDLVVEDDALTEHPQDILGAVRTWNKFMDRIEQPWWLDGNIMATPASVFFYTKSYKILGDVQVSVDTRDYRTRFVARADRTNIRESFLGHTSPDQDGAIILADRLYDFTTRDLWPLMDPSLDEGRDGRMSAYADLVRAEVHAGISAESAALLQRTASERQSILDVLDAVRGRRSCGSTFVITELPWNGLPSDEYKLIEQYAHRDRFDKCPAIRKEEAERLITSSEALKDLGPELERAVGELVAHAARAVSVHEARHADDHAQANGFKEPLSCAPCDKVNLPRASRAELSAYLASFAHESTGYTALFQACAIIDDGNTPHAIAMRVFSRRFDEDICRGAPPPEHLKQRAEALELEFFERSHSITLPSNFPSSLELYMRAD